MYICASWTIDRQLQSKILAAELCLYKECYIYPTNNINNDFLWRLLSTKSLLYSIVAIGIYCCIVPDLNWIWERLSELTKAGHQELNNFLFLMILSTQLHFLILDPDSLCCYSNWKQRGRIPGCLHEWQPVRHTEWHVLLSPDKHYLFV